MAAALAAPAAGVASLRTAVFDYIESWFNTRRLHSTLGYHSRAR